MTVYNPAVTVYQGPAGDHNDRAMAAVRSLGAALSDQTGGEVSVVGQPAPAMPSTWDIELVRATPTLQQMATRIDEVLTAGACPVSAITRCAVALATQPVVLKHRPDAVVVWLDAHGDINVPTDTTTAYLGGMALSGPMGWWDTGLGAGLPSDQAILVGARDLDPAEQDHIDAGRIAAVPVGPDLPDRLAEVLGGRPVYLHIDCDVLEPGIVATDYHVPGGLTLDDLHACATTLTSVEVVGVEISEYEGDANLTAADIVAALNPLWTRSQDRARREG